MSHPDEDTLLKYTLETLDAAGVSLIRQHLLDCRVCREEQEKIEAELRRLRGIAVPVGDAAAPPLPPRSRALLVTARAAAILVAFLAGYLTAELSSPPHPAVPVQQRLIPAGPTGPSSGYVSCRPVDIRGGQ